MEHYREVPYLRADSHYLLRLLVACCSRLQKISQWAFLKLTFYLLVGGYLLQLWGDWYSGTTITFIAVLGLWIEMQSTLNREKELIQTVNRLAAIIEKVKPK